MTYKQRWHANYYKTNRDRILARVTKRRKENAERIREDQARYREANREKLRINKIIYRKNNRDKILRQDAEWRKANPEKMRQFNATYYAHKRKATIGDLTDIAKVYERSLELRKWFDVAVDHIIPLAKGGTHEASNLQIIYSFENSRKHAKLNFKPKVIFR